jgi:hypothetical protein
MGNCAKEVLGCDYARLSAATHGSRQHCQRGDLVSESSYAWSETKQLHQPATFTGSVARATPTLSLMMS